MARRNPSGPKTLDMFPDMERFGRQGQSLDLAITCPRCGRERVISRRDWIRTSQAQLQKFEKVDPNTGLKRTWTEAARDTGPNTPIFCHGCQASPITAEWHRAYERAQLEANGMPTARSLHE